MANVSPLVEQWRSDVERYAQKYGVSEYVELILAMIAQESGGDADRYPDIMQSSESAGVRRMRLVTRKRVWIRESVTLLH